MYHSHSYNYTSWPHILRKGGVSILSSIIRLSGQKAECACSQLKHSMANNQSPENQSSQRSNCSKELVKVLTPWLEILIYGSDHLLQLDSAHETCRLVMILLQTSNDSHAWQHSENDERTDGVFKNHISTRLVDQPTFTLARETIYQQYWALI